MYGRIIERISCNHLSFVVPIAVAEDVYKRQVHVGRLVQDVNGGPHPVVHPRRVGNQSYTLTFQASEILFFQYLDTGDVYKRQVYGIQLTCLQLR